MNMSGDQPEVTILDDMSGIRFDGNIGALKGGEALNMVSAPLSGTLERAENGLYYPQGLEIGAPRDLKPFARENVGPSYYQFPAR